MLCPATPQAVAAIPEPTRGEILRVATAETTKSGWTHLQEVQKQGVRRRRRSSSSRTGWRCNSSTSSTSSAASGSSSTSSPRSASISANWSRAWPASSTPASRLRQIGVRDEAKLLADYGDCGKPVCCNTHMVVMPPVCMRMAKLQKSTLDPTKISGRCGRLKCCLRFEQDVYEEFQSNCRRSAAGW